MASGNSSYLKPLRRIFENYRIPDSVFVRYFNLYLQSAGAQERVSLGDRKSGEPRYKISDPATGRTRYFPYRKQGLRSYWGGICKRGENLRTIYLLDHIEFHKSDTIIDCGANIGDFKISFDERNIQINYVGIEPGEQEFQALTLNAGSGSSLHNVCLGEADGTARFYYKPEYGDSSMIKMKNFQSEQERKVKTLDHLIEEIGLTGQPIKLLKLEAEGAEPEVCGGALESFGNIEYVCADLGFERGESQESTAPAVVNLLLQRGFGLVAITRKRLCMLFKNSNVAAG